MSEVLDLGPAPLVSPALPEDPRLRFTELGRPPPKNEAIPRLAHLSYAEPRRRRHHPMTVVIALTSMKARVGPAPSRACHFVGHLFDRGR